jgi:hypothetical protein
MWKICTYGSTNLPMRCFVCIAEWLESSQKLTIPFLISALLISFSPHALATQSVDMRVSDITIEEAIEIAKGCVLERDIEVVGSFIESARYERVARASGELRWVITWAYSRATKGGRVVVYVDKSRMCNITYSG